MSSLYPSTPGERFHAARKRTGLTQKDVAAAAGVAQSTVAEFEGGQTEKAKVSSLVPMCIAVNVTVEYVWTGSRAARREAQAAAREKLPAIKTVCLQISGIDGEELLLLRKRAATYLREDKFTLGTQQCDATVSFVKLAGDRGVIYNIPGWLGPSSRANWSIEGTYTLTRNGVVERDSETINTRDHYTNVALIEWLADALVQPIREAYKPAP